MIGTCNQKVCWAILHQARDGLLGEGEEIGSEKADGIGLHNPSDFIKIPSVSSEKAFYGSGKITRSYPESQRES